MEHAVSKTKIEVATGAFELPPQTLGYCHHWYYTAVITFSSSSTTMTTIMWYEHARWDLNDGDS